MTQQPSHPAVRLLTRHPLKPGLYSREPHFREAFADLEAVLGERALEAVLGHGLVVVKPDGHSLGVTSAVADFYQGHGFEVIDVRAVVFTPVVWRSLWVYQMTQASIDRLLVNDLVISGEGIALLFRGRTGGPLPACVRLSALKGSARMKNHDQECLRRVIRQPNVIFSLVHSADEPADLVRELGILFGMRERRAIAAAMASGQRSAAASHLLGELRRADAQPGRTFDRDASRKKVIAAAREGALGDIPGLPAHRETLRRAAGALEAGHPVDVPPFLWALADLGIPVDSWDLAVTLSEMIEVDDPGASKIIENLGAPAWEPA